MTIKTRLFPKFKEELTKSLKKSNISLQDKVFVITGTTSGTGFVAARTVAEYGGIAVLLNRKSKRVDDMVQKLKQEVPNGKFDIVECDLQSFDSVRKAIQVIKSKYAKIYCLANNAGIMATPDEATVDGYDKQMQTNHLSHFLLTAELLPLLQKEATEFGDARVVNHSSVGRHHTPRKGLEEKYFQKNGGNLGGNELKLMAGPCFERYFQTKLANSVFTHGLHELLTQSNVKRNNKIRVISAHPGGSDTNLSDHLQFGWLMMKTLNFLMEYVAQTPEDGAMGLIKGMMDPNAESGILYGPNERNFMGGTKGKAVPNPPKAYETDPIAIDMLWKTSEAATGVTLSV